MDYLSGTTDGVPVTRHQAPRLEESLCSLALQFLAALQPPILVLRLKRAASWTLPSR